MAKGTVHGRPARYNAAGVTLTDGDGAALQVDAQGRLKVAGSSTGSTANTPSIASAATALAANSARKGWQIQNLGTNPLFVLLGNGASATVFHAVLKAGTAANDGLGGSLSQMDGVIYTGIITIAGTAPSYTVLEL
jgi:hypothetical protein